MYTLTLTVTNQFGTLARIANQFCRRGCNLKTLNVTETVNPDVSVIKIVADTDSDTLEQISRQLLRLCDVIESEIADV